MGTEPANRIVARAPRRGSYQAPMRCTSDPDDLEGYLEDAAHYPGGACERVCRVRDEADVAELLAGATGPVLVVGAQSSLTGGATPRGGTVISTAQMGGIKEWLDGGVRVGPGLVLAELEQELRARELYYPPVPTYDGATIGGTVATNAAGAATFKYGSTRDWIAAITVVLTTGDVLDIRRGAVCAGADGVFEIERAGGEVVRVEVPGYRMPEVPKRSAGYFAAPGMDLIDLFIGSEGTLGVVTEIELRLVRPRPEWFAALVPVAGDAEALALVADMREQSLRTRAGGDEGGLDVAAIEFLDRRCLELLAEDGARERTGISWPPSAGAALIVQAELPAGTTRAEAFEALAGATGRPGASGSAARAERSERDADRASSRGGRAGTEQAEGAASPSNDPAVRREIVAHRLGGLVRVLEQHGVLADVVPVLPGETARRDALFALREAAPEGVNRRIGEAKRAVDPSISKAGGDVIVPFDRLAEALARYREIMTGHGLDHAIWGHISDGNLHPNVIPRSREEMERAERAQLEIGEAAISLGGCPMSEHGVGRNPIKQELLRRLYGESGIEEMRRVKRALDPRGV
ncbi:MAG: FAD-binding oxidoreductase, partial [Deltaproteobacteria bacterium]